MAGLLLILLVGVVLWAVVRSRTAEGAPRPRVPRRPVRQARAARLAPDDDPEFLASLRDVRRRDADD